MRVVRTAESVGIAGSRAANTNDRDWTAVETQEYIDILEHNAKKAQEGCSCGGVGL